MHVLSLYLSLFGIHVFCLYSCPFYACPLFIFVPFWYPCFLSLYLPLLCMSFLYICPFLSVSSDFVSAPMYYPCPASFFCSCLSVSSVFISVFFISLSSRPSSVFMPSVFMSVLCFFPVLCFHVRSLSPYVSCVFFRSSSVFISALRLPVHYLSQCPVSSRLSLDYPSIVCLNVFCLHVCP